MYLFFYFWNKELLLPTKELLREAAPAQLRNKNKKSIKDNLHFTRSKRV